MSEQRGLWELRIGLVATPAQAEAFEEQITAILCPDPDHSPPCPVPWSAGLTPGWALDGPTHARYELLLEQVGLEAGAGPSPRPEP